MHICYINYTNAIITKKEYLARITYVCAPPLFTSAFVLPSVVKFTQLAIFQRCFSLLWDCYLETIGMFVNASFGKRG